jgi:NMD protein affecting ribosome stability and mRNA decay
MRNRDRANTDKEKFTIAIRVRPKVKDDIVCYREVDMEEILEVTVSRCRAIATVLLSSAKTTMKRSFASAASSTLEPKKIFMSEAHILSNLSLRAITPHSLLMGKQAQAKLTLSSEAKGSSKDTSI